MIINAIYLFLSFFTVVCVSGCIVGAFIGAQHIIDRQNRQRHDQRNLARKTQTVNLPPPSPPRTFQSRLAKFTNCEETELGKKLQPSTMSFWTAMNVLEFMPPKSAAWIRRHLISIQKTLQGMKSGVQEAKG